MKLTKKTIKEIQKREWEPIHLFNSEEMKYIYESIINKYDTKNKNIFISVLVSNKNRNISFNTGNVIERQKGFMTVLTLRSSLIESIINQCDTNKEMVRCLHDTLKL